jgi:uncharacterized protein (DUF486 family)
MDGEINIEIDVGIILIVVRMLMTMKWHRFLGRTSLVAQITAWGITYYRLFFYICVCFLN